MGKRFTVDECLTNARAYHDTDELADWLAREAKKYTDAGGTRYWLKEIEVHILGQHALIKDMAWHLKKSKEANEKRGEHAVD